MVGIIMRLAPVGAFGAMAFTVGRYGLGSLVSLGALMAGVYVTCAVFVAWCWVGVDRFMSEVRAITNLIGNAVATVAIARWDTRSIYPGRRRCCSRHRRPTIRPRSATFRARPSDSLPPPPP